MIVWRRKSSSGCNQHAFASFAPGRAQTPAADCRASAIELDKHITSERANVQVLTMGTGLTAARSSSSKSHHCSRLELTSGRQKLSYPLVLLSTHSHKTTSLPTSRISSILKAEETLSDSVSASRQVTKGAKILTKPKISLTRQTNQTEIAILANDQISACKHKTSIHRASRKV
jgi:hypothetical protein